MTESVGLQFWSGTSGSPWSQLGLETSVIQVGSQAGVGTVSNRLDPVGPEFLRTPGGSGAETQLGTSWVAMPNAFRELGQAGPSGTTDPAKAEGGGEWRLGSQVRCRQRPGDSWEPRAQQSELPSISQ